MNGDDDIPDDFSDAPEPGPLNKFEKMIFEGPQPAPPHLIELAATWVNRAKLKFKDFRVDREEIEIAVAKAAKDGAVSQRDARLIFLDTGDVVSLPLAQRYIDMREFELMAKYLRTRLHYHNVTRLTPRNRMIIDGMIAGGEAAMAVSLLRLYLKKLRDFTQNRWRAAGRKPHPDASPEGLVQFERMKAEEIRDLPANLEIAELELAEIEPWIAAHGSREDNRAVEKFREEIGRVRKRFAISQS